MLRSALGAAAILAGLAFNANAATIGFSLNISGSQNVPVFDLENTSTSSAIIQSFSFTIGHGFGDGTLAAGFNFDGAGVLSTGTIGAAEATLISPDTNLSGGVRSEVVEWSFITSGSTFGAGDNFVFNADVDENGNTGENYKTTFGNNGAEPNSIATVAFLLDGETLTLTSTFPDEPELAEYNLSATEQLTPVPLPAALPLLASALGGFGLLAWRRSQRAKA